MSVPASAASPCICGLDIFDNRGRCGANATMANDTPKKVHMDTPSVIAITCSRSELSSWAAAHDSLVVNRIIQQHETVTPRA